MTLPKRILDQLATIYPDRTRAVVKVTEAVAGANKDRFKPLELIEMAPGKCLIVVGPSKVLRESSLLNLIEIAPARYLVTVASGTSVEALEIALRDAIHHLESEKNGLEDRILHELLELISHQRRSRNLSKAEILIIDGVKS